MAVSIETPLALAELEPLLRAAVPETRLVPARLLRRIIRHERQLTGLGLHVPHHKSYVIDRERLLHLVTCAELGEAADADLPSWLLLIARPEPEELAALPRGAALLTYWRLLFHGSIHRAIGQRIAGRQLTPAAIRERIHRIGQSEFNEIRTVLRQEKYLLPPRDDPTAYEEFAALYLELSHFATTLLPHYFPAIEHFKAIDAILAADVDAAALFTSTRPAGAPDPVFPVDLPARPEHPHFDRSPAAARSPLSAEQHRALLASADRAAVAGNAVRAVLQRTAAALAAPADQAAEVEALAQADLARLVERLRAALDLGDADPLPWQQALTPLLAPAAWGLWPAEARLLYDLQKVCVERERPVSALLPVDWLYSGFRQPLVQSLPDQPLVLAVKHLRRAAGRLPAIRVTEGERHALAERLQAALQQAEERLRERFRPLLVEVLREVGLCPRNFPERVAFDKLIEELLDQITTRGFLNLGDLRDALSRNQLKLPDLAGAREFFAGDPLLRANRELARRAVGVYQRGEVYLRWLQRGSALAFGTRLGRWWTLFLALPFGGAYATIIFVQEMFGLLRLPHHLNPLAHGMLTAVLGVFGLLVLHRPGFRRALLHGLWGVWDALLDLPVVVWRLPPIRLLYNSRLFLVGVRYLLKPLPVGVLAWLGLGALGVSADTAALGSLPVFLAASLLLNSHWVRDLEEALLDWAARRWDYFRELLPGLARLLMDIFKRSLEAVDRLLYAVDEWLRFRGGESRLTWAAKAVLGLVWSVVAYVIRLYVNVLIEPTVNPLKHFPAVTVAAKLLVPFWIPLTEFFAAPLMFLGEPLALGIAFLSIHTLPGAAGFLVWELKENWRLYRANRPGTLQPAVIGSHGETLLRLLKPGFHSGTLPKLYAKLRRAERRALRTDQWQTPRRLRAQLHHVEDSLRQFTERELLAFLNHCPDWTAGKVQLTAVETGSNHVRLDLACPTLGPGHLELKFEEQSGWLLAQVSRQGWQPCLSAAQAALLTNALIGFYKRCGVDLVREQVTASLARPLPYDIADEGLVVWPDGGYQTEVVYDLGQEPLLLPQVVAGSLTAILPVLTRQQVLFSSRPVSWPAWVTVWEHDPQSPALPKLLDAGSPVLPPVPANP